MRRLRFLSVLMLATFFPQFASMLRCTSTIRNSTNQRDAMGKYLTFPTTSKGLSLNTREFCSARGTTMKIFLMNLWEHSFLKFFQQRRMKMLCIRDGFRLFGVVGVDFCCTSELLNPNMNVRLLIKTTPNFNKISDNPSISLGTFKCLLYTGRIVAKILS